MKQKMISEEDRLRLREFLSFNPFFKEMDEHLLKSGFYDTQPSEKRPCIEQIWLKAIKFVWATHLMNFSTDCFVEIWADDGMDEMVLHLCAVVKEFLLLARYKGLRCMFTDSDKAWLWVTKEYERMDRSHTDEWHRALCAMVEIMYASKSLDFLNVLE